jgi:hypothetical protein
LARLWHTSGHSKRMRRECGAPPGTGCLRPIN